MPVQNSKTNDTSSLRKARGAFFTPREISDFISRWTIRSPNDLVLEPSCGEARFLLSAGSRLRSLAPSADLTAQLVGIELHEQSAENARQLLSTDNLQSIVKNENFFDVKPEPRYDAVVGNPPYVRYQGFSGSARTKGLEAALAQGVRLSLLANSWAAFVIHAAQFVKPTGRLGLVLPAELLSVNYAAQVRRFLLNRFASLKLVMFEELVFPDVLEEVVLLLAEGTGPTPGFELYQARNLNDLESTAANTWTHCNPQGADKWTTALIPSDALRVYQESVEKNEVETLLDWGESYLGIVTGNNKYFTLTANQLLELNISPQELLPISPPGSRHLRGLTFSKKAWEELLLEGNPCYLFYPNLQEPSIAADRYIAGGKARAIHTTYKCRVRKPWWRVPIVAVPDLFLTYMDHTCPRLITNEARVHHLNSLYGLTLKVDRCKLGRDLLPIASLNSLTLLGAEIIGRSYGGGILKLEPSEADRLPFPSRELLQRAGDDLRKLRPQLAVAFRQGDVPRIVKAIDSVLLRKHLGIKTSDLQTLRNAREMLFKRRTSRGKKIRGEN